MDRSAVAEVIELMPHEITTKINIEIDVSQLLEDVKSYDELFSVEYITQLIYIRKESVG